MDPVLATALTILVWVVIIGVGLVIVLHVLAWLAVLILGAVSTTTPRYRRTVKPPKRTPSSFTRSTK